MNIALILAGGTGSRAGSELPKQYVEVAGKPIIAYCMEVFEACRQIDRIQVVAEERWRRLIREQAGQKLFGFSDPGDNRQLSIYQGLRDILSYAEPSDRVIVHDAARPFVSEGMIRACLEALERHEGVVPVLPMKDTVYESADGRIVSLLDRSRIVAGQAPEGFLLGRYYEANRALLPDRIRSVNGSTEAAVLAGMDVVTIAGEERNVKLTTREDMEWFCRALCREE